MSAVRGNEVVLKIRWGGALLATFFFILPASVAATKSFSGRISFYASGASSTYDQGGTFSYSELIMTLTFRSTETDQDGLEYGFDARGAGYPSTEARAGRLSLYNGFIGAKLGGGLVVVRAGQMWLNDLGSLGSLGGGLFEFHVPGRTPLGKLRAGIFYGYEPKILEAGYVSGVTKYGGYLALEGEGARRHVLGYITLRNSSLTERSVLLFNNYLPIGTSFFLYQAAEYDLLGPLGTGAGHLTYFFANARYSPISFLEFQGTFHRGLSIDTRSIVLDRLNGRPVDQRTAEGFLYESLGGRLTVNVSNLIHLYAGYSRDQTNLGEGSSDRLNFGLYASNIFKSGLDVNISDWKITSQTGSSYDSWYASLGRNFSRTLYVEGFYSSAVSVLRLTASGFRIDSYPRTQRFGFSAIWNALRTASLQFTAERTLGDQFKEYRGLAGISYRF
jgi:hypothetical protein